MASVAAARYGKDNVRVYKVHRDEKTGVQTVTEMTVCVLLEGAIETSYVPHPIEYLPANQRSDTPKQTIA